MLPKSIFVWVMILLVACTGKAPEHSNAAMDKFDEFIKKEKFLKDSTVFYPGISDITLKPILSEKINLAADDFKSLSLSKKATNNDYQDKIKIGLQRFDDVYLKTDTEDRERICHYFEELMDIVGLESSGGHLNNFMYGFNP